MSNTVGRVTLMPEHSTVVGWGVLSVSVGQKACSVDLTDGQVSAGYLP